LFDVIMRIIIKRLYHSFAEKTSH